MACSENPVLEKKLEKASDYGNSSGMYNLTCDQELRVTITLAEYRDLITKVATRDAAVDQANKDKYSRESENKRISEENAKLKAELYELKKKLDEADTQQPSIEIPATGTFSPDVIKGKVGF